MRFNVGQRVKIKGPPELPEGWTLQMKRMANVIRRMLEVGVLGEQVRRLRPDEVSTYLMGLVMGVAQGSNNAWVKLEAYPIGTAEVWVSQFSEVLVFLSPEVRAKALQPCGHEMVDVANVDLEEGDEREPEELRCARCGMTLEQVEVARLDLLCTLEFLMEATNG